MIPYNSVRFKLIFPPFLMFLIIIILAITVGKTFFYNAINKKNTITIKIESNRFINEIEKNKNNIHDISKLLSSFNFLKKSIYNNSNKTDSILNNELKGTLNNFDYNIDIISLNGIILFSNHQSGNLNQENINIINAIKKNKQSCSCFSELYGKKVFLAASPIIDKGNIKAYIFVSKTFDEFAKNYFLPEKLNFFIIDNDNNIILKTTYLGKINYNDIIANKKDIFNLNKHKFKQIPLKNSTEETILTAYLYYDMRQDYKIIYFLLMALAGFSLFVFIIGGLIYVFGMNLSIVKPVKKINQNILKIANGEIIEEIDYKSKDEFGNIIQSLNTLIINQRNTTNFAKNIGNGIFDIDFKKLSYKDELGNTLIEMKNKLEKAKIEEEKRKEEKEKENWITTGLAKFANILRQNFENLEDFGTEIIKNLVKYTKANQGGIFIYNNDNPEKITLDLLAVYAYNRKKYLKKSIKIGEGLVGSCAIEKNIIYLTDVPEDYLEITSGLGKANPRNILIVPLKIDEQILGVIEIASFEIFDKYTIGFIEKVSENIAQSINSTKINIRTTQLLEQSQQQQEEMKAQEEELRQNMEEILATQEEAARKEAEMKGILDALNNASMLAIFDTNWNIISVNKNFEKLFGLSAEQMKGEHHSMFSGKTKEELNALKDKILHRAIVEFETKLDIDNKTIWLRERYSAVNDSNGKLIKIINLSIDISKEKEYESIVNPHY